MKQYRCMIRGESSGGLCNLILLILKVISKRKKNMNDLLHFRRQFLLTNQALEGLTDWQHKRVSDAHLYAHPDLQVTEKEKQSVCLFLLGYIFDPANPNKSNEAIVSEILSRIKSFGDLIKVIKPYAGRYALIYKDENSFMILHDPLGLREIFYCTHKNRVICGSQPNLLDMYSEPKLGVTTDKSIRHFYEHDMPPVRSRRLWVGDETYFQSIKHLMPNHCLDISTLTAKRYWPNRRLERMELGDAARKASDYLKGVLKAVTSRYDVMMAVTSGTDSRSLFAASRDVKDKIYYFINKHNHLSDVNSDIRIPRSMFQKLNIPFHIHEYETAVDEEFKNIFLNNVFLSTELMLPAIYNVYYKQHQDKINLLGVGEIGREYYGDAPSDLDGYYLARCLKYKDSRYATAQCEKWLQETKDVAKACNVDIMRLLLWECLLGNWGVVGNSESDIAIEEFNPYDSHYLYEILLSADQTQGDLFEAMFKIMWPELLEYPFNPPDSAKDRIKTMLSELGLMKRLKGARYRYDRRKYLRKVQDSQ